MSKILLDAVGSVTENGAVTSWVRTPYGIRLSEDPSECFKNIQDLEKFILGEDGENQEIKANVTEWFGILNSTDTNHGFGENYGGQNDMVNGRTFYTAPNYTDTRVGGNDAINPYWQFNRDDDITPPLLRIPGTGNESSGMGRVYAEMYDDNQQILWLQFGVPEFTSLVTMYAMSGNAEAVKAMNTGGLRGLVGKIINTAVSATIWAIFFPIASPIWITRWLARFGANDITKYYRFRPAMGLYYDMVNTMMSYLAVSMGIYPQLMVQRKDSTKKLDGNGEVMMTGNAAEQAAKLNNAKVIASQEALQVTEARFQDSGVPDVLKNGPDIYVIMNRRAKLFADARVTVTTRDLLKDTQPEVHSVSSNYVTPQVKYTYDKNRNPKEEPEDPKSGVFNKFFTTMKSHMFGANDFVGFRVERSVNCSESINNSTGPTGIAQKLNQIAEQNRSKYEDVGNSWSFKVAKDVMDSGWNAALKNVGIELTANVASLVGAGDIGAILTAGNGFLDIPEIWKNSSFQKSYNFNVQLRARYGDPVTIYQSIYIPLCMLLVAASPRSIGDNMYTSPFIVKAYCKGMFSVACGIIDNMSITRGKDEFGWNNTHLPTSIDVSFSIKDLSPTMFMAMQDIGLFDTFSRNESMMDYLDTLSALGITERMFGLPRMMRKLTAACLIKKNTIFSPIWWGAKAGRSSIARAVANVFPYANYEKSDMGLRS